MRWHHTAHTKEFLWRFTPHNVPLYSIWNLVRVTKCYRLSNPDDSGGDGDSGITRQLQWWKWRYTITCSQVGNWCQWYRSGVIILLSGQNMQNGLFHSTIWGFISSFSLPSDGRIVVGAIILVFIHTSMNKINIFLIVSVIMLHAQKHVIHNYHHSGPWIYQQAHVVY